MLARGAERERLAACSTVAPAYRRVDRRWLLGELSWSGQLRLGVCSRGGEQAMAVSDRSKRGQPHPKGWGGRGARRAHRRVDEAVGEGGEEIVFGVLGHHHPLAHRQRLRRGGSHHVRQRRVHEAPAPQKTRFVHNGDLSTSFVAAREGARWEGAVSTSSRKDGTIAARCDVRNRPVWFLRVIVAESSVCGSTGRVDLTVRCVWWCVGGGAPIRPDGRV